jgi:bifunctional DNA-binding transcriptional regulator/antitoxin component of YhaV-PrlF toxin-antitoxin module
MTVAIKNDDKTPLVVPRAVRRTAGFKSGQELEIKAAGGVITILPKLPTRTTSTRRSSADRSMAG